MCAGAVRASRTSISNWGRIVPYLRPISKLSGANVHRARATKSEERRDAYGMNGEGLFQGREKKP